MRHAAAVAVEQNIGPSATPSVAWVPRRIRLNIPKALLMLREGERMASHTAQRLRQTGGFAAHREEASVHQGLVCECQSMVAKIMGKKKEGELFIEVTETKQPYPFGGGRLLRTIRFDGEKIEFEMCGDCLEEAPASADVPASPN